MNSKVKKLTMAIIVILILIFVGYYLFKINIGTVNIPADATSATNPQSVVEGNTAPTNAVTSLSGFTLPAGFSLNIFAKNVPGARVIEIDPKGRILVSETNEGKIVALTDKNNDNISDEQKVLVSGLNKPHGLAMHCSGRAESEGCFLYVAERDLLSRFPYNADIPSLGPKEKLMTISSSITDRHFTRSLLFLPSLSGFPIDDTLLISVGSSCDVCNEKDTDHAAVLYYNIRDGAHGVYAKGLRNATFMALNPLDGKVYATEMGRDNLGDNIPPDEINIISGPSTISGQSLIPNFGWPNCYGKNIHDTVFDKNTYIRNPCMEPFETPSFVDLQAHSAPLGLAFIEGKGWPEKYRNSLLVAYHGSWNRSAPTGYKIALIKMSSKGEYLGTEDFITGWLTKTGTKTGRPVDIKILPSGAVYISDDSSGVIYKLTFR